MRNTIKFGESLPDLQYYDNVNWNLNESYNVEFFPNDFYFVSLISANSPNLNDYLNEINITDPIALDLEWEEEISSLQFGIQKRVLVIRHPPGPGNKLIYDFLNSHNFFAKGTHNDKLKLFEKFGNSFEDRIEDIEKTRLLPYNYSLNFCAMTLQFAGKPTAEFKDIKITKSNWDLPQLTMRQVLYAAFDVVAIFRAYPNFPKPKEIEKKPRPQSNDHKEHKSKKTPIVKINKKERQTSQNEWKSDGHKIFLKQSQATKIHCYIIPNYQGKTDFYTIKTLLRPISKANDIDNISCYSFNETKYLFISLFSNQKELLSRFQTVIEIPPLNPNDSSDYDVLFLYDLPPILQDTEQMSLFLNCFGCDHRVRYDENSNVRVQPHRAQSSLRMKHFIPFLRNQNGNPWLKMATFPLYLPMVRATFPSFYNKVEDISSLLPNSVKNISLLQKRNINDKLTAIITFSTVDEAEQCIDDLNYKQIEGKGEIYVQRYTDENHFRFLRFHELLVFGIHDEIKLRKRFEKYGKILQAIYDPLYNVSRVFFYDKNSALIAVEHEECVRLVPLSTMAFIRQLPLSITDNQVIDLTKPYGKTLGFVFRDINEESKSAVVEVMFSTHEEALALKNALHHKRMENRVLEVNASTIEEIETPTWKMQQRKRWITYFLLSRKLVTTCNRYQKVATDQTQIATIEEECEEEDEYSNELSIDQSSSNENSDIQENNECIDTFKNGIQTSLIELIKKCEEIGPVIDIKLYSDNQTQSFFEFDESKNYSKIFIQLIDSVYQTQCLRRIKDFNIHESTISEYVNEIFPDQFNLQKIENKKTHTTTQPYAIVINHRPTSLNHEVLPELFPNKKFDFVVDGNRLIIYVRTNKLAQHIFNVFKHCLAMPFSDDETFLRNLKRCFKSGKFACDDLSNDNVEMCLWYKVSNRPQYHPFERDGARRKMPIVIDPVSKDTTALSVRQFCSNCGKFEVKIDGSAIEIGKKRIVIQPRNTKAKVACFSAFENDLLNGCQLTPIRMKREDILPPLPENLDDLEYN